jgi:hypothetical protein
MNANSATKPGMMPIKNLAKNGPVGVLKRRCTTRFALTFQSTRTRPRRDCSPHFAYAISRRTSSSVRASLISDRHRADWDQQHPPFNVYCSGLTAYEYTPDELRDNVELRREFPPHPLVGLCDGQLHWRRPETIAFDRQARVRWDAAP